ncbi:flagellar biosynthetic protein FliO [Endozoicomonas sp. OPT23]|uniref:flagellar biosynthetic protein FliO n=1 Tax=Endozoicomonas sp. OPT23 TaxID=2072845 RepID=UPI00129A2B00|nr:flagellar biosynthetic protein FliO [Endozoicomonas sp. OPT23]MRI33948.1 flagellar biosynthetic protein FliO [Endozoicomonas sp. OPT23]
MFRNLLLIPIALMSPIAQASEFNTNLTESLIQILLMLGLVIGLILALAWLTNKTGRIGNFGQSDRHIRLIETTSFGRHEKLSLVQVGDKQLLLGVTSQGINLISEVSVNTSTAADRETLKSPLQWATQVLGQNKTGSNDLSSSGNNDLSGSGIN